MQSIALGTVRAALRACVNLRAHGSANRAAAIGRAIVLYRKG